ncbi:hypothetical protein CK203_049409 [Vitis vinifera]|uniref:Uncharacterized protein n=1 Tax=Vitis vinifera TaxID=29760 RepID=A0A438FVP7_VITVI|nr:hypothetical protein CK203_049409 [Vitis vinifera]
MDVSLESKSLPSVGNSRKSYLQVTSQKLARGKLVHLYGWRSLALPSVGSSELKAKLQENIAALCKWLRNSPGKHYKRIRICVTGKLKRSPLPSGVRIPDARHPDGMAAVAEFRMCDIRVEVAAAGFEWNVKVAEWNVAAAEWNSFPVECVGSHTPCILDLLMDSKEFSSISVITEPAQVPPFMHETMPPDEPPTGEAETAEPSSPQHHPPTI